jgi:putative addiction module component (TIGR02574 family)
MRAKVRRVLREALRLPPKARADIAGTLLHSLDEPDDAHVETAWAAEIERRLKEVQSGRVKLIPWEKARRSLWAGLKRAPRAAR